VASAELSRRAEKVVTYRPQCDTGTDQPREFHEALFDADSFEDLPGKWQAAIVKAEQPVRPIAAASPHRSWRAAGAGAPSTLGVACRIPVGVGSVGYLHIEGAPR
jgi:hypothetical protein